MSGATAVSGAGATVTPGATVVSKESGEIQANVQIALVVCFTHELTPSKAGKSVSISCNQRQAIDVKCGRDETKHLACSGQY